MNNITIRHIFPSTMELEQWGDHHSIRIFTENFLSIFHGEPGASNATSAIWRGKSKKIAKKLIISVMRTWNDGLLTKTLVSNGRETKNVHLEWIFNEKNVNRKCYWERQSQCYIEDRALCQRKWEKTVTFTFLAWNKCTCQIQISSWM